MNMRNIIKNKEKLTKVIGFIVFISLLVNLFFKFTYLFRNTGYNRNHIIGLKSEKNIDAVFIGGSATFVYWEPLKAYSDYGFTSYDLATDDIGIENILSYIKYAEKYQNPKLYVIGIRAFQYYTDEMNDGAPRNASDSMDLTFLPRYELVTSYLQNRKTDENTDYTSYYLDITKYHTNYDNLKSNVAWDFINNRGCSEFKGCELPALWAFMDEVTDFRTTDRTDLLHNAQKELDKVLDYCDSKDLDVLFVVCPYSITQEHYAIYNTIADQVTARGYGYLNTNDYYDEMGIDFSRDFYNKNHVNVYGAEKYTAFIAKYISDYYKLPDHRDDSSYDDWDKDVIEFENYSNQVKKEVDDIIEDAQNAVDQGKKIRKTSEFTKWCEYVNDYHYSLICIGNGEMLSTASEIDKKMIEYLGIDTSDLFYNSCYMNVLIDSMHNTADWKLPEAVDGVLTVPIGQIANKTDVVISNNECSIKIADEECSRKDIDGINIVVFDNYYRTVIDSVTLKLQDGDVVVVR